MDKPRHIKSSMGIRQVHKNNLIEGRVEGRIRGGSGVQGKEEAALTSGFKSGCGSGLQASASLDF